MKKGLSCLAVILATASAAFAQEQLRHQSDKPKEQGAPAALSDGRDSRLTRIGPSVSRAA